MSKFAERLDEVLQDGDTLTIERVAGSSEEADLLRIKFVTENDRFGTLNQVEFISVETATPGKLIKTIEEVKGRIISAVETIMGAQAPVASTEEEEE